jgi:hypothetical protein
MFHTSARSNFLRCSIAALLVAGGATVLSAGVSDAATHSLTTRISGFVSNKGTVTHQAAAQTAAAAIPVVAEHFSIIRISGATPRRTSVISRTIAQQRENGIVTYMKNWVVRNGFRGEISVVKGKLITGAFPNSKQDNYVALTLSGWRSNSVVFNAHGGKGSMAAQSRTTRGALRANTFSRAGWAFSKRTATASGAGAAYSNKGSYSFTRNVTLYAQWRKLGMPVTTTTIPTSPTTTTSVPLLDAPTNVSGTTGVATQSSVSWTPPSANGSTILGYTVQYASSPYSTWTSATTAAGSSPYVVTGLVNGTSYEFRVAAHNSRGVGAFSSPSAPIVPADVPVAPAAPGTTSNLDSQVALTWSAPNDNGAPITNYEVRFSTDKASWTSVAPGDVTSYTVTGLVDGTTYYFEVQAYNTVGWSPWSSFTSGYPAAVPSTPTVTSNTTVTGIAFGSPPEVAVSFTAPAQSNGYPVTSYGLRDSTNAGVSWATVSTSITGSSYTITSGLQLGASVYVEMNACNSLGCSAWNPFATVAVAATVPGNSSLTLSGGSPGTSILVSGINNGPDGGSVATNYILYRASATVASCATTCAWGAWTPHSSGAITSNYTDTGLDSSFEYRYEVALTNAMGTGNAYLSGGSKQG